MKRELKVKGIESIINSLISAAAQIPMKRELKDTIFCSIQ